MSHLPDRGAGAARAALMAMRVPAGPPQSYFGPAAELVELRKAAQDVVEAMRRGAIQNPTLDRLAELVR